MQTSIQQQGPPGGGGNPEAAQQAAEFASTAMEVGLIVGMVIALGWALVLAAFYLWGWSYVKKDRTKQYFGVTN